MSGGAKNAAVDGHRRQHGQQGRHQAADPVAPEPLQPDARVPAELGHQQPGDEEPGQDEEDVHAEEPAPGPAEPAVEEEDQAMPTARTPSRAGMREWRRAGPPPPIVGRRADGPCGFACPPTGKSPTLSAPGTGRGGTGGPGSPAGVHHRLPLGRVGGLERAAERCRHRISGRSMRNQLADGDGEDDGQPQQLGGPEPPVGAVGLERQVHGEVHQVEGVGQVAEEHQEPEPHEPRARGPGGDRRSRR